MLSVVVLVVMLPVVVMLASGDVAFVLVDALPPVMVCDIIVVLLSAPVELSGIVVMLPVLVMLLVELLLVSLPVVVVSLAEGVGASSTGKIRLAIEPLAENVAPPVVVAFVVVALPVLVVLVVVDVVLVLVAFVAFCASTGERLNAVAKSPKTSTSAIAIGAFFIADNVRE